MTGHIKPFLADDGKEYFVTFVHPFQMECLEVMKKFWNRDRRRIKRELRKVDQKYRFKK